MKRTMNKYRNKQTVIQGHVFDSIKEAERYLELGQRQKKGEIQDLALQPSFVLQYGFTDNQGKKHRPITYIADFMYWETKKPEATIVEDVKGMKTEVYKLKKKLLLFKHKNIIFREIQG